MSEKVVYLYGKGAHVDRICRQLSQRGYDVNQRTQGPFVDASVVVLADQVRYVGQEAVLRWIARVEPTP